MCIDTIIIMNVWLRSVSTNTILGVCSSNDKKKLFLIDNSIQPKKMCLDVFNIESKHLICSYLEKHPAKLKY